MQVRPVPCGFNAVGGLQNLVYTTRKSGVYHMQKEERRLQEHLETENLGRCPLLVCLLKTTRLKRDLCRGVLTHMFCVAVDSGSQLVGCVVIRY